MEKHQGYVVERIVSNQKQEICYDGPLNVENLPAYLCPPLSLKHLEVAHIKPQNACDGFLVQQKWPKQTKRKEQVVISLICHVVDRYGQCAEGVARIVVDACTAPCKGNLRRGAAIDLVRACFCGSCVFDVQAELCLQTVVSCCELFVPRKSCAATCKPLPLYPPPSHRKRWKAK